MNTFEHINDVLYNAHSDVVRRRKNPLLPIVATVAGLALMIWSLTSGSGSANLTSALLFGGLVVALAGIVMTLRALTGSLPVYKPTGERLWRSECFFDQKNKRALCEAIDSRSLEQLLRLPQSDTSAVVLTLYATRSGSFMLLQAAEYIPHRFVPVTAIAALTEPQAKVLLALAS